MSQPFAFALVLGWGTPAGVVALGACSALADLLGGKAARKVLFNSAQLAIALGAAGVVYGLAGGDPGAPGAPPGPARVSLPAFAAAALAFFVVNNLLVEAVLVLAGGTPALDRVRQGVGLRAWVAAMLLGMAPVVTVVAQTSLGLVPILGLPTAAVYLACRGAIRADRERARAEAAAEQARATAAEQARLVEGEQALVRQLQESERLKRDLLATVSHELKTPLTVILGTLGTLSRRGAALDPAERREFVDMAVRQGTRLKELIEQLLLAARFEQTAAEPAERPLVDGAAVARDALAAARVAHPGRELVLVAREALPIRATPEPSSRSWATCSTTRPSTPPTRARSAWRRPATGPWPCWPWRTPAQGCPAPTASASSSASPSSTRGPPGGPAGSAWACTSPASWPTARVASWSWPTRSRPAGAPASSCACPWPSPAGHRLP
jgi:signal transduction histidine kinase